MFGNEYATRDSMDSFNSKSTSFVSLLEKRHPAAPSAILSFDSSFEGDVAVVVVVVG